MIQKGEEGMKFLFIVKYKYPPCQMLSDKRINKAKYRGTRGKKDGKRKKE